MTSQQFLVCDSSTLANFKQWGSAISAFFSTAGWSQGTDTGQVNWSTIGSVPGSGAFVYEIWEPNDSLTNFYLKVEYGNVSGTNCPSLRLSIGTSTNGAGTLTGYFTPATNTNSSSFTPPSTVTQYECDFSGTAGRIGVMMWRNAPSAQGQEFFAVERSINSSGSYTSAHVTLVVCGLSSSCHFVQQTVVFGVGVAPANIARSGSNVGGLLARAAIPNITTSTAFNGTIGFDAIAPYVGFFDYSLTMVGIGCATDIAEGVTFNLTLYGSTRTFMPSAIGAFAEAAPGNLAGYLLCMRYD